MLAVDATGRVRITVGRDGAMVEGWYDSPRPLLHHALRHWRRGIALDLLYAAAPGATSNERWSLRIWPDAQEDGVLQVAERSTVLDGQWALRLPGTKFLTHHGLASLSGPSTTVRRRLGTFTQHGQLYDLSDWLLATEQSADDPARAMAAGIVVLRPGSWTPPVHSLLQVLPGAEEGIEVHLPMAAQPHCPVRRTYALVLGPSARWTSAQASDYWTVAGQRNPEPAKLLARLGFARPERLAAYRRQCDTAPLPRPTTCLFGEGSLERAMAFARRFPELSQHPMWSGDVQRAKSWMLQTLQGHQAALRDEGYLHPRGNPVSGRVLAPACAAFHLLDLMGSLDDFERRHAAALIAETAELHLSRDFYAWHIADDRALREGFYRGMLNQNFNTDRYCLVGLAGCVLPHHPRAAHWRRHFIQQLESQLSSFVYDGGAWEESHTYHQHVLLCLLPVVQAMRHAEGVDLLQHPRLRAICRFHIPLLSPPDRLLNGSRGVPAIGDHGYIHPKGELWAYLHSWLARMWPERRDEQLWAWRERGLALNCPESAQASLFSPLLLTDPAEAASAVAPELPRQLCLPGFGAALRHAPHTPDESLLVIRCGEAWGHYHLDQGSFWWWVAGTLVCADAGLGEGSMKGAHAGHNTLGYPGRSPQQYFDRVPYRVSSVERNGGTDVVRCEVPVRMWQQPGRHQVESIPPDRRPHTTRIFRWSAPERLVVEDHPRRSPDGRVEWRLWVVARVARQFGSRQVEFDLLDDRRLVVELPAVPQEVRFENVGTTCGVRITYAEQPLRHELRITKPGIPLTR